MARREDTDFGLLARQVEALADEDAHWAPLLSNTTALLAEAMPDVSWVGFYLLRPAPAGGTRLVLGPFQGKLACVHIGWGSGVCGTAIERGATQLVSDVREFPGHIACDAASRSEVVVPMRAAGRPVGVLDLDSTLVGRFDRDDAAGLEVVVATIEARCDFAELVEGLR